MNEADKYMYKLLYCVLYLGNTKGSVENLYNITNLGHNTQ